ncbi:MULTISPECIES: LysR substrate-binding domain-containing protein [Gemmobacter]|uniref:Transcriptional regulator n=2 Tax=Gemmobacter TaxID=204456 RepID=A0A2T6AW57_9RHOB|nr:MULTISPECIES: LysR substrate-binding domain-containing protein [Gemmobacter]OJY34229.1 MAG: transcriptional regulator [Rhodobacterales bacterium 65-51]PTX47986.1 transcriptional regulator [Gemmobacter caeni]TWI97292.1 LysR family glycine cleavage system transcriptional activator [Gemmobacter caeni]GHC30362.1 LysR family transcriptional regulator [Gemmobacter nanjingensis]
MSRIPSTQALRALESFARHGTVWQAADELNLTRSAVSHQLRLLERDLGFRLMNRIGTRVELTPQGLAYAIDVRRALAVISGSATRNAARGVTGALTVSCPPGFASSWLCTRIGSFSDAFPDVVVSLVTPRRLDDVSNPDVDVFITFGLGNQPGMEVELLKEVEFTPLCSPILLNRREGMDTPQALLSSTLLHLTDFADWEMWFQLSGLPTEAAQTGIRFSDMNLVYAAALGAQGVAMGDEFICQQAMATGLLIRPFDLAIRSPRSYFMIVPPEKADNPASAAFRGWLRAELPQD